MKEQIQLLIKFFVFSLILGIVLFFLTEIFLKNNKGSYGVILSIIIFLLLIINQLRYMFYILKKRNNLVLSIVEIIFGFGFISGLFIIFILQNLSDIGFVSKNDRFFDYLIFYIWTSITTWELIYFLNRKIFRTNVENN